ncbi:TIR domain-containing protein [Nonomuraea sp. NPDC049725]|uniref:TIR domain-containing protein n=1 Tax=Nonomuraea sp. NPDC049725 TaxID=3154508 RepID=UPI0034355ADF
MARRTFFSFHYGLDVWRAAQVRNSYVVGNETGPKFIEAGLWEESKLKGDAALMKLINDGLYNTTVTVVLIGSQTSQRRWVQYEIQQSIARGNGLLGVYVHNIKDQYQRTAPMGANPLPAGYATYDWVLHSGYVNIGTWIDKAYSER